MVTKRRPDGYQNRTKSPPSEIRDQSKGKGYSPNPYPKLVHLEVFSILKGGIDSLDLNDYGRPWPDPRRNVLAQTVADHDPDLCLKAAWEAREIVQSQDRAPNITALYAKKLDELSEARRVVRESLEVA